MKRSILMSIMLTFGFNFSSQIHCNEDGDKDLEMDPLIANQTNTPGPGLKWREVEPHLYNFYRERCSCQSCCDSMSSNRCSCIGCVVGGISGSLCTGFVAAVCYTTYHIHQCIASCGRGYQGLGWCTPENTCFTTYTGCENSCDPSGNAYTIGLYSCIGGLVVTGAVTVGMCLSPCLGLVQYCKDLDDKNDGMRKTISNISKKYINKEDDLLCSDDIKNILLISIFLKESPDLIKKLNTQQRDTLDSII